MSILAYLLGAAILIAWAGTAIWDRRDRRRDERDWQAMVDEADGAALHWRDRYQAEATMRHAADIAVDGLRKTLAKAEREIADQRERVLPAAPWPGAALRIVSEGESPVHDALVLENLHVLHDELAARQAARKSRVVKGGKA